MSASLLVQLLEAEAGCQTPAAVTFLCEMLDRITPSVGFILFSTDGGALRERCLGSSLVSSG